MDNKTNWAEMQSDEDDRNDSHEEKKEETESPPQDNNEGVQITMARTYKKKYQMTSFFT